MGVDFLEQYQKFVKPLEGDFNDIEKISLFGLGVAGEAGDVASCIKKTIYHKNEQIAGIKENLGDTLWYITAICNYYGWSLEEVINENMEKLKARYKEGKFKVEHAKRNGKMIDWNEK